MAGLSGGGGGSGGASGSIRAGRAYVELGVNDTTATGLAAVGAKLKSFGKEASRELEKFSGTEGLKGVAKGGLLGFGAVAAAASLAEVGKELRSIIPGLKTADETFKSWGDSLDETARRVARLAKSFAEMREDAPAGAPQAALFAREAAALRREKAEIDRERRDLERRLNDSRAALDTGSPSGAFLSAGLFAGAQLGLTERFSVFEARAKEEVEKRRRQSEELAEQIRLAVRAGGKVDPDPAGTKLREDVAALSKEAADFSNPALANMTALERKLRAIRDTYQDIGEAEKARLDDLQKEVKLADERAKQLAVEKDFLQQLSAANLDRMTQGLSAEDAALARMVERGFSNDQIQQLRHLQEDLKQNAMRAPGTTAAGSLASSDLGRQLGTASQWGRLEKRVELTNEKLNEIRGALDAINKNMGFK
jgi:hypothetical protein